MPYDMLPIVRTVYVRANVVYCPHCDADIDGWMGDPRDTETTCDSCKKQFKIAADADIRFN